LRKSGETFRAGEAHALDLVEADAGLLQILEQTEMTGRAALVADLTAPQVLRALDAAIRERNPARCGHWQRECSDRYDRHADSNRIHERSGGGESKSNPAGADGFHDRKRGGEAWLPVDFRGNSLD